MVWFAGYLGKINVDISESYEQIDNFSTKWEKNKQKLSSFIRIAPIEMELDDKTKLITGTLFYEYLKDAKRIVKEGDRFKVVEKKNIIDTQWTKFWFTEKSYMLIEKRNARKKGFELLSEALTGAKDNIKACKFDIEGIFDEYPLQWLGAFRDREGNIQKGTFYGINIIEDDEMGEAYSHTVHKNQVGFITTYFGPEIKVKITREGYVQIYTNLEEEADKAFQFIRDELSPYIVED